MSNQQSLTVKMALNAWSTRVQDADKLFNSLSDEQLQKEIAPHRNRGIYLLGHLAAVNDKMLSLLNLGKPLKPELHDTFLTKPDKTITEMPAASEVRDYWNATKAALEKHFSNIPANEWFEKHTSVSDEDFNKEPHRNKLNVVISRTNHLSYHLGQLIFLKN
jgi:hypothetical protein